MIQTLLVIDADVIRRMGGMVRHLCVGMIDEAVQVTVLNRSDDGSMAGGMGLARVVNLTDRRWSWRRPTADSVLEAMRMPKDTEEELAVRARAMQEGYKAATRVPFSTVEQCKAALDLCREMVEHADPTMISDVGTGALMARAGVHAAAYNVRINLPSIDDEAFRQEMVGGLQLLVEESDRIAAEVAQKVDEALEY